MAKERNCIFCGKSYQYCPNCGEYNSLPKWMYNFDSEKCHDLYEVIGGYNIGKKTKEDIQQVLIKHNITDYSQFSQKLQNKLNTLFSSAPVVKEETVVTETPVIEENVIVETQTTNQEVDVETPVVEETQAEESEPVQTEYKPRRTRRYHKKYTEEANTEE